MITRRATLMGVAGAAVAVPAFAEAPDVPAGILAAASKALFASGGFIDAKVDYGAVGDGSKDDTNALQNAIDAAFVVCPVDNADLPPGNKVLFIPPGVYKITRPLLLDGVFGARMYGAGNFTTRIYQATADASVIVTNGCRHSHFSDMWLQGYSASNASGACFDLDWDGYSRCSLQGNMFVNMKFGNNRTGLSIGTSGVMGSENQIIGCAFAGLKYGIRSHNYNALQNNVIGGNFASCSSDGIYFEYGNGQVIGVGFQGNGWDINSYKGGSNGILHVSGCRSESTNFVKSYDNVAHVSGCLQTSTGTGTFVEAPQPSSIINCVSFGKVKLYSGPDVRRFGLVQGCQFGRDDWCENTSARIIDCCRGKTLVGSGNGTFIWMGDGYVSSQGGFDGATYMQYGIGASPVGTLTDAATVATDAVSKGTNAFTVTLAGNRTLGNPTGLCPGQTYTWIIKQDATGDRTLAYGNLFTWPGGSVPTLSTAANAIDVLTAFYDGSKLRAQLTKAYA